MNLSKFGNTAIFYLTIVVFFSCSKNFKKNPLLEYEGKYPDESAKDIEIMISDSGIINFILYAPIMNKYGGENSYIDFPKGITIVSYMDGEKHSILTADYAISQDYPQRMEATKNVVIVDLDKKESIKTEQLIWDKQNKRIYSESEVMRVKEDGTIDYGDGFESDERFTKYAIKNPRMEMLTNDF